MEQPALKVKDLVEQIQEFLKAGKPDDVTDLVNQVKIIPESIEPYRFFNQAHYTRNLIFKNEMFEMLTLGWSSGQKSWIHNHHGQHCWMMVMEGTLGVRNYKRLGCDQQQRTVQIAPLSELMVSSGSAATVDPVEPIHLVWNPQELQIPALSIHVYSMPFDTCVIYDAEKGQCRNVKLFYTSKYGTLLPEIEKTSTEDPPCACALSSGDQKVHCGAIS